MKSFYASVECVRERFESVENFLYVFMSRADNSAGLILASSPMFKKIFGKSNVGRSYDLPLISKQEDFRIIMLRNKVYPQTLNM